MRNFHLMRTGLDTVPLLNALHRNHELWNQNPLRTQHEGTSHSEADDIWLRFTPYPENMEAVMNGRENINYPAMSLLPAARRFIFGLMTDVEGERLGRVLITRLAPGKRLGAHRDEGDHAAYYDRYHVVLKGLAGSQFICGPDEVCMKTGEVWWFDNKVEHTVINNSAEDRIHLIADIRTSR